MKLEKTKTEYNYINLIRPEDNIVILKENMGCKKKPKKK